MRPGRRGAGRPVARRGRPRCAAVRPPTSIHSSTRPDGRSRTTSGTATAPVRAQRPQAGRLALEQPGHRVGMGLGEQRSVGRVEPEGLGDVAAADRVTAVTPRPSMSSAGRSRSRRADVLDEGAAGRVEEVEHLGVGGRREAPRVGHLEPRRRRHGSMTTLARATSSGARRSRSRWLAASIATTRSKRSKSAAVNWRARWSIDDAPPAGLGQRVLVGPLAEVVAAGAGRVDGRPRRPAAAASRRTPPRPPASGRCCRGTRSRSAPPPGCQAVGPAGLSRSRSRGAHVRS